MESAIPEPLRCPRTRAANHLPEYTPPNPAFSARFAHPQSALTIVFLGAQYRNAEGEALAKAAVQKWSGICAHAPDHHDVALGMDEAGYRTLLWTGYWRDPAQFYRWRQDTEFGGWWAQEARLHEPCGWFMEVAQPGADRLETLFSSPDGLDGVGRLAEHMSGQIREHGYWGSMRDRLPVAQTDALQATTPMAAPPRAVAPHTRVAFSCADNVALIRSAQDWSATQAKERALYLTDVEPVLREGMAFLDSEQGLASGCLASRYLTVVGQDFMPVQKSYGLSWWSNLKQLEQWAQSHASHEAIFGTFMQMVQALGFELALRLSHEVSVLRFSEQSFEYVNCHAATGVLRACVAADRQAKRMGITGCTA